MSATVATAVELVTFTPESRRAEGFFRAFEAAAAGAGIEVVRTASYRGHAPWLLLWGPGAPDRAAVMQRHVAAGGRALVLDLAYWDRERKARVSIDAAHPARHVMAVDHLGARFLADHVHISNDWDPRGPVLIAGLGDKARVQYGPDVVDAWETARMRDCIERWPTRPILYRKKKAASPTPGWAHVASGLPIEQVLKGKSLVITWHSNVAVDAIRMGIPVVCQDGAAAAVCTSVVPSSPEQLPLEVRARFLANLAWFQWAPEEARQFWAWAQERLS